MDLTPYIIQFVVLVAGAVVIAAVIDVVLLPEKDKGCATLLVLFFAAVIGFGLLIDRGEAWRLHQECDTHHGEYRSNGFWRDSCILNGMEILEFGP